MFKSEQKAGIKSTAALKDSQEDVETTLKPTINEFEFQSEKYGNRAPDRALELYASVEKGSNYLSKDYEKVRRELSELEHNADDFTFAPAVNHDYTPVPYQAPLSK